MYQNGSHLSFDPDSDLRTMFWIKFTYSFSTQILFLCKAQYLALATDCKILDARDYPMKNWKTVKTKLTKMHLAFTNISGAFRSGSTTQVSGQSLISIRYILVCIFLFPTFVSAIATCVVCDRQRWCGGPGLWQRGHALRQQQGGRHGHRL